MSSTTEAISATTPQSLIPATPASGAQVPSHARWLHFTGGDALVFKHLAPCAWWAIAIAAVLLFQLALCERAIVATRGALDARWRQTARAKAAAVKRPISEHRASLMSLSSSTYSSSLEDDDKKPSSGLEDKESGHPSFSFSLPELEKGGPVRSASATTKTFPPLVRSEANIRGCLQFVQMIFRTVLLFSVMTYQAAYIIAIVLGLSVGEMFMGHLANVDDTIYTN